MNVHGNRFFIWASYSLAEPQGVAEDVRATHARAALPDGYAVRQACRSICHGLFTGAFGRCQRTRSVGAGSCITTRKRACLYARPDRLRQYASDFTGQCQPSPRRALGDGGRGGLRRAVGGCRRNPWRPCGVGFHRHKTAGAAGRCLWRTCVSDPKRRSRRVECGPNAMARGIPAIPAASPRQLLARICAMGCGSVPGAQPAARTLGGAL